MKTIVAGNWKMNLDPAQSIDLVSSLKAGLVKFPNTECVIFPPYTSITLLSELLSGSIIKLGAQNIHPEESGAFTGEVSALMIKNYCSHVILGHSERRILFGETDDFINRKVLTSLKSGITPILCVGETLKQREAGLALSVCLDQLIKGLAGVKPENLSQVVVAYEPVWAIGTGMSASPVIAQEIMCSLRNQFSEKISKEINEIPFLYGGSVNADNAIDFAKEKDINGALVGGASLDANAFIQIAKSMVDGK